MNGGMMSAIFGFLIIILAVLTPIAAIWGLNVLFGLAIPYTFETWLAVLAVKLFFINPVQRVNND